MEEITYNLEQGHYYEDINHYSEQLIANLEQESSKIITEYMNFIEEEEIEDLRNREEYLVEFLALGVLANQYLNDVLETSTSSYLVMQKLFDLKNKYNKLEKVMKLLQGWLSTLLLYSEDRENYNYEFINKEDLKSLIQWLAATGEYEELIKRFKKWQQYFNTKFSVEVTYDLKTALELALWFKEHSKKALGKYTKNVEEFLTKKHHRYVWSENVMFCAKPEIEYHLNMAGIEIINKVLWEEFLAAEEKIILAPICMRNRSAQNCQAQENDLGLQCTHCDRDCNINLISSLGSQGEFKVVLVDQHSNLQSYLEAWENQKQIGLIAISCVLNLLSSSYQLRELNIPAQFIALDYCGCKQYWSKEGVVTDINLDKLLEIIKADPGDKFIQMRFFSDNSDSKSQ
ncbi:MAG: DUF116 domain-containing protein [Bacillota bacterium]